MNTRDRLPDRREGETYRLEHVWLAGSAREHLEKFLLTVGHYPDGRIGEVFIDYENNQLERNIALGKDIATLMSIALQYGAPVEVLRDAMGRSEVNRMGATIEMPYSIIGTVLDHLAGLE